MPSSYESLSQQRRIKVERKWTRQNARLKKRLNEAEMDLNISKTLSEELIQNLSENLEKYRQNMAIARIAVESNLTDALKIAFGKATRSAEQVLIDCRRVAVSFDDALEESIESLTALGDGIDSDSRFEE